MNNKNYSKNEYDKRNSHDDINYYYHYIKSHTEKFENFTTKGVRVGQNTAKKERN